MSCRYCEKVAVDRGMCGACRNRTQWRAARDGTLDQWFADHPKMRGQNTAIVDEAEWLLSMGETPTAIARRFGYTRPASLSRRMRRYGRTDLARLFERVAVAS